MSSFARLDWTLPAATHARSSRDLIRTSVAEALCSSGWLCSPRTTHHVRDLGDSVRVSVVTLFDDVPVVRDDLSGLLGFPPSRETAEDALLVPSAAWYHPALQVVTHVALDVLDARCAFPLSEYAAFEDPSEAAPTLTQFLGEISGTFRGVTSSYERTEAFWLDFFRRPPAPGLERSGELLWNLAG